jgi:hypothetical protein
MLRRMALVRTTRRNIQEDGILHSHRCENLRSYKMYALVMNILTTDLVPTAVNDNHLLVREGSPQEETYVIQ